MMKAKIICITGLDGSGKSTLVNKLALAIPSVYVSNIWDIMDGGIQNIPFNSKKDIDDYLCELTPDSRLLFLAHALKYSIDKALQSGKEIILVNAYYYKYFAMELVLGADPLLIETLSKIFPQPDSVIFLELKPEIAAERKSRLSRYETGLAPEPNKSDFIAIQKKVMKSWEIFDKTNWYFLDSSNEMENNYNKIFQ